MSRIAHPLRLLLTAAFAVWGCGSNAPPERSPRNQSDANLPIGRTESDFSPIVPVPFSEDMVSENSMRFGDCILDGSPEWMECVSRAIVLLGAKHRETYDRLQKHVGIIYQGDDEYGTYCSIRPWEWPFPVIFLSPDNATTSSLCAASLAHESFHAYVHDFRYPTPRLEFEFSHLVNQPEELAAIQRQIEVGLALGVGVDIIEYWRREDGMHFKEVKEKWRRLAKREGAVEAQINTTDSLTTPSPRPSSL